MKARVLFLFAVVFLFLSEAYCEVEVSPVSSDILKNVFIGIVVLVGIAIIAIKMSFKKTAGAKGAAGPGGEAAGEVSSASSSGVRLKPARLVELHNSRVYDIPPDGELTMGRVFENAVVIKSPSVSRHHAKIVAEPEGYALYDLGSKKGTFVNGEMIERKILRNSDMIEISSEDFMFTYK